MSLTTAQLATLKAHVLADPALAPLTSGPGTDYAAVAAALNADASPDYWVYRQNLTKDAMYNETSPDATTWNWNAYVSRQPAEQNGWLEVFYTGSCDPSRASVRAAWDNVFSGGTAAAVAQRAHCAAMARRKATRAESVLATGNGQSATPSTLTFFGTIGITDVNQMFQS